MTKNIFPFLILFVVFAGCVSASKHQAEVQRSNQLLAEKKDLENKRQNLAMTIQKQEKETASLKEAKQKLTESYETTKTELKETQTKVADLKRELAKTETAFESFRDASDKKNMSLQSKLKSIGESIDALNTQLKDASSLLNEVAQKTPIETPEEKPVAPTVPAGDVSPAPAVPVGDPTPATAE